MVSVESVCEGRVLFNGASRTVSGHFQLVRQGHVRQGICAGVGYGTWHVADRVVDYTVLHIDGVSMGGLVGGFDASALVNCHVNNDCASFH